MSCHSHTSSSSRNNTTMTQASSTRSCYDVNRNKNQQCCNSLLLQILRSFLVRESLLCDVFLHIAGLDSVFGDAIQNAKQLFSTRLPQMFEYCVMRECENILCGYLYDGDLAFVILKGIYGFKFPKRFLEISSRDLTFFLLQLI